MKKYLKNQNFYYVLIPAAVGVWAMLAGFIFYPNAKKAWESEKDEYQTTQGLITKLVTLQPKRLFYEVDEKDDSGEFDFTKTINEFAQVFSIAPSNCSVNDRGEVKRAKRRTRSANVTIKKIDVQTLAQFLSGMLLRWPDLKCEVLSLQKVKNTKNDWKVDIRLTYYY